MKATLIPNRAAPQAKIADDEPTAWAMDGFQNILMRGLEFQSVLMPAGVLLGYALAFFGFAIWRFRFEERKS